MHHTCSNPRARLISEQDRMATCKGGQDASQKQQNRQREFREQYSNFAIESCCFQIPRGMIYITRYAEVTASRSKRSAKGQLLTHNVTYYPNRRVLRRWDLLIYLMGFISVCFVNRNCPGHLEEQRSKNGLLQELRQRSPDRY